jgi:hypothetical protein
MDLILRKVQFPALRLQFLLGSNSATEFPARLRREFCKNTNQHQWFNPCTFTPIRLKFAKIPCIFPASREFGLETGSLRLGRPPIIRRTAEIFRDGSRYPNRTLQGRVNMPKDMHEKAAEHHEQTAKAHWTAAQQHGTNDHVGAKQQSAQALEKSKAAHEHSTQANNKSQQK